MNKIREEYPDRVLQSFTIYPSPKCDVLVEPYNALLSLHHLLKDSNMVMAIDIEGLYRICFKTLKQSSPSYKDLDQVVCSAMSGATASLRFPGQQNQDLGKMVRNLVPEQKFPFLMIGHSPLSPSNAD